MGAIKQLRAGVDRMTAAWANSILDRVQRNMILDNPGGGILLRRTAAGIFLSVVGGSKSAGASIIPFLVTKITTTIPASVSVASGLVNTGGMAPIVMAAANYLVTGNGYIVLAVTSATTCLIYYTASLTVGPGGVGPAAGPLQILSTITGWDGAGNFTLAQGVVSNITFQFCNGLPYWVEGP